ncbi:MAG: alkaline phosphatase [Clostridia bacterium]|nr:alkaline phosphatase [Clostridia bacterium]
MKKVLSVILVAVLLLSVAAIGFAEEKDSTFGAYKRVFIIGIDGAGRFIKDADTPNFDRIFKDGAVDYTARAEVKTDSGPNWGAILTGVSYFKTKLDNGVVGDVERGADTDYPTVFNYIRRANPDAVLASYCNWSSINHGIVENDIGVEKVNIGDDAKLTDAICEYFDAGNDPELFFVQFDSVDHEGHSVGSKGEAFFNQMNVVDGYLGRVYDTLEENGLLDDALFIVTADHGHTTIGGHGGITMRETNVTVAAAGKTVVKGGKFDSDTRNRDVAAMTLYALGYEKPEEDFTARIPANLFEEVEGEARPVSKDFADYIISALAWVVTLITSIV